MSQVRYSVVGFKGDGTDLATGLPYRMEVAVLAGGADEGMAGTAGRSIMIFPLDNGLKNIVIKMLRIKASNLTHETESFTIF